MKILLVFFALFFGFEIAQWFVLVNTEQNNVCGYNTILKIYPTRIEKYYFDIETNWSDRRWNFCRWANVVAEWDHYWTENLSWTFLLLDFQNNPLAEGILYYNQSWGHNILDYWNDMDDRHDTQNADADLQVCIADQKIAICYTYNWELYCKNLADSNNETWTSIDHKCIDVSLQWNNIFFWKKSENLLLKVSNVIYWKRLWGSNIVVSLDADASAVYGGNMVQNDNWEDIFDSAVNSYNINTATKYNWLWHPSGILDIQDAELTNEIEEHENYWLNFSEDLLYWMKFSGFQYIIHSYAIEESDYTTGWSWGWWWGGGWWSWTPTGGWDCQLDFCLYLGAPAGNYIEKVEIKEESCSSNWLCYTPYIYMVWETDPQNWFWYFHLNWYFENLLWTWIYTTTQTRNWFALCYVPYFQKWEIEPHLTWNIKNIVEGIAPSYPVWRDDTWKKELILCCSWSTTYWCTKEENIPLVEFGGMDGQGGYGEMTISWNSYSGKILWWSFKIWENIYYVWGIFALYTGNIGGTSERYYEQSICDRNKDGKVEDWEAMICWETVAEEWFKKIWKLVDSYYQLLLTLKNFSINFLTRETCFLNFGLWTWTTTIDDFAKTMQSKIFFRFVETDLWQFFYYFIVVLLYLVSFVYIWKDKKDI